MPTWLIIILLAILAVGLFVLAMSLTLIFKGHHIDSEISTNENMRKLGIKCAVQETREQMTGLEDCASEPGCSGNCAACTPEAAAAVHGSAKKIIGDKFSANRKHGQSESDYPCFYFLGFNPTMPRGGQSAAEHSPTIISASGLQPGILRARQKNQGLTRSVLL